jgi:hypothetical protein
MIMAYCKETISPVRRRPLFAFAAQRKVCTIRPKFYENDQKCSFGIISKYPIMIEVVHIGGKIMQHVLTLRKIFLVFGFVLAFIDCASNKAISQNDTIGLTDVKAGGVFL